MLRTLGIILLAISTVALFLSQPLEVKEEKEEEEQILESTGPRAESQKKPKLQRQSSSASSIRSSFTMQETLKEDLFWKLFLMITFGMSYPFFMKASFKNYGSVFHKDDEYLTLVATFVYLSASSSKFIWGFVLDAFGFKKVYTLVLLVEITLCFTLQYIASDRVLYIVWIVLTNFCEGAHFTLFPTVA